MKTLFLLIALCLSDTCLSQLVDTNSNKILLSNEEKSKILLEETYRNEILYALNSKPTFDVESIIKILQGLAIIIGLWATYREFKKQNEDKKRQERDRFDQTAKEFRKFFFEKQFDYYAEATEAVAILATEEINSEDYKKARKDFYRLFWGRLSIVEEKSVEESMAIFKDSLEEYEKNGTNISKENMEQLSRNLAHNAGRYTITVWIDSAERVNYNR